ncbi:MAG: sugar ABC transporter ATP-binding protein [Methylobacteriaceae bacterium]|nr:sugar ABC transporter ATP-binding protein [Methylobacteriaceae bacterium]
MLAKDEGCAALETRGLGKRFPGVVALADVSLAIKRGEIHALVGQNGAGKSTLVNILSGMLTADEGEIRVEGHSVDIGNPRRAIELGIVTVYQELSLLPNLSVAQNIALGREPRRRGLLDAGAMRAAARGALDRIGVAIEPDRKVGALSLAERQLVEVAKALSHAPSVLVLDEPTAPLAAREADRLFGVMHALRSQDIAVLFVSHKFREILDHCDRATILRNGRKVTTTALTGLSEADLTEAMIGTKTPRHVHSGLRARGDVVLEAAGLSYGKVRDVSLTFAAGEIVALTGLLGAGQNDIARLLGGDLVPEDGEIRVRGRPARFRSPRGAVAAGICLLTDDRKQEGILPNLPLGDNIALPSLDRRAVLASWIDQAAERRAVGTQIARFGVVARSLSQPMRTLSGGNQQKALLSRWHLDDCAVFVLIEPTRGVDVGARAEIYRRMEELAADGRAIVIVSSDIQEVLAVADRILVVRDGRIAAETSPRARGEDELHLMVQGAA